MRFPWFWKTRCVSIRESTENILVWYKPNNLNTCPKGLNFVILLNKNQVNDWWQNESKHVRCNHAQAEFAKNDPIFKTKQDATQCKRPLWKAENWLVGVQYFIYILNVTFDVGFNFWATWSDRLCVILPLANFSRNTGVNCSERINYAENIFQMLCSINSWHWKLWRLNVAR